MDSILTSIKKMLGLDEDYTHFDADIIMHINSVLATLTQLAVGSSDGFSISDKSAVWGDLVGDRKDLEAVKSYVYLKVRMLFDPPTSSAVMDSMNRLASEYEWRICANADPGFVDDESDS